MSEYISSFLLYLSASRRMSSHTIISYENDLNGLKEYLLSQYELESITEAKFIHIRSYIVTLLKVDMKPKSINRKISTFRSFYKYGLRQGFITSNPMLKVSALKVAKRLPEYVKSADISTLFDSIELDGSHASYRDYVIMVILYNTGMRRAELISLKDSSIDYSRSQLTVIGKGQKQRIIPISKHVVETITHYIKIRNSQIQKVDSALILTDKGKALYPKLVYNTVHRMLSLVSTNVKQSPHILRHSFATHMTNNGAELNTVKELLGHASLAATQIYTHNSISKLKEVYKKSHPKAEE